MDNDDTKLWGQTVMNGILSRRAVASFVLALAMTPSLAAAQRVEPEIEIQRGIEYANHDGVALQGDLYLPKAAGPAPVVIAVHGGGWQVGSRAAYASWGNWLAARGIGLFAVTYRLAKPGQPAYPQAVHDVRAAVQFIRARGLALKVSPDRVDPEKLALMGDSAGAHLAALVALAGDDPAFAGAYRQDPHVTVSTKVKAVVGAYGVYDLTLQYNHDLLSRPQDSIVGKFLGSTPWDNRRLYFDASPMSYVTSANKGVSFLLAYGTEDDVVDRAQSDAFLVALKQAGSYARNMVMQGHGHFWMLGDPVDDPRGASAQLAPRLLRFLQERL